jgi:chromosome segregation ATPase
MTEKLEKETRLLKKAKSRAKKDVEASSTESERTQAEMSEMEARIATLEVELKGSRGKLEVVRRSFLCQTLPLEEAIRSYDCCA